MQLSVAMCTFNGAAYLREQLDSISHQTRLPDKMVICDDGSTDDTAAICDAYHHEVSFPVAIYNNAETLGSTRNFEQAIQLCSGDIIALADQDDVWLPEKLARLEAAFSADAAADVVFSDAEMVNASLRPLGYQLWQRLHFGHREQQRVLNGCGVGVLLKRNVVTGATMALRARLREVVLPVPPSWGHDEWIALMTTIFSRLTLIREPLVLYRQHPGSQIGAKRKDLTTRIKQARRKDLRPALMLMNQFVHARDHLVTMDDVPHRQQVLDQLGEKINHLQVRASLQDRAGARWVVALKELAARRYHRYSNGFSSFARDILS